jgi:hypothetical protein
MRFYDSPVYLKDEPPEAESLDRLNDSFEIISIFIDSDNEDITLETSLSLSYYHVACPLGKINSPRDGLRKSVGVS